MKPNRDNQCSRRARVCKGILTVACWGLSAAALPAAVFVDWGGNYVSSNQVFQGTGDSSTAFRSYTNGGQSYSVLKGSLQQLAPDAGYSAPSGKTSAFSGGFMGSGGTGAAVVGGSTGTASAINARAVVDNSGNDRITVALSTTGPAIRGMIYFDKQGFLGGFSGQTVGFDGSSALSFSGIMDGISGTGRWVVQDGGVWYISQASFTQSAYNTVETHSLTDPNTSTLWAVYAPVLTDTAGAYYFDPAPGADYVSHTFTDIQDVGVFFDSYGGTGIGSSTFSRFALQSFSVSGIAIPEPEAAGMLLLGGLAAFLFTRRAAA